ncbi:hypothetical protein GHK86_19405 [Acidimicrobiaceae bacterium USS-CC1]|uniref:Uncharacterized protein n=1 Tax=Acidiferrimicrobium australe TaxID=2664430 RepID=A0ABW9QZ34_9ACTN|nr:hypothetical protein [Acidiferrimicrobium australe]
MAPDPDDEATPEAPRTPLDPKRVMRVILPSFVASMALAAAGLALFVVGQRTIGLILVVVATVGGLAVRTRLVYREQVRQRRS